MFKNIITSQSINIKFIEEFEIYAQFASLICPCSFCLTRKQKAEKKKEQEKLRFSGSEYLSILGRFCVRAGTPVEIEKCTSSKTERDTKIAELMTTAPPTKPNTNSSMHPGFMALCWHGETPEPRRLHRGRGCIFVGKVCHSAAATKTMPSAAAFHSSAAAPKQWHHLSSPSHRAAGLLAASMQRRRDTASPEVLLPSFHAEFIG